MGHETLRTVRKILAYIEARRSTDDVNAGDIVSKHVTESAKNFISKLRGRGRKSARERPRIRPPQQTRVSSLVGTNLASVEKSSYLVHYIVTYVTCPIFPACFQVADQVDESPS